jgi:hypothetical protein
MKENNYNGALQQPIGSGFHAGSTSDEVIKGINLHDKIAIVTGGNTGIGLETVKSLSKQAQQSLCLQGMCKRQSKILRRLQM